MYTLKRVGYKGLPKQEVNDLIASGKWIFELTVLLHFPSPPAPEEASAQTPADFYSRVQEPPSVCFKETPAEV